MGSKSYSGVPATERPSGNVGSLDRITAVTLGAIILAWFILNAIVFVRTDFGWNAFGGTAQ